MYLPRHGLAIVYVFSLVLSRSPSFLKLLKRFIVCSCIGLLDSKLLLHLSTAQRLTESALLWHCLSAVMLVDGRRPRVLHRVLLTLDLEGLRVALILIEAHHNVWITPSDLINLVKLNHAFHLHAWLIERVPFKYLKPVEASLLFSFQFFCHN